MYFCIEYLNNRVVICPIKYRPLAADFKAFSPAELGTNMERLR